MEKCLKCILILTDQDHWPVDLHRTKNHLTPNIYPLSQFPCTFLGALYEQPEIYSKKQYPFHSNNCDNLESAKKASHLSWKERKVNKYKQKKKNFFSKISEANIKPPPENCNKENSKIVNPPCSILYSQSQARRYKDLCRNQTIWSTKCSFNHPSFPKILLYRWQCKERCLRLLIKKKFI